MTLDTHGYQHFPGLVRGSLAHWCNLLKEQFAAERPGLRISGHPELAAAIRSLVKESSLNQALDEGWQCVRAIAFNKSPNSNWALGWHQDRTIAVEARHDVPGFGPWSRKDGILHVEPPFPLLVRMRTLRIHLDNTAKNNGALTIAVRSHLQGRIPEDQIERVVNDAEIVTTSAKAGDAWLYATPILHASGRAETPSARRVLQLDFSQDELPAPLGWLKIG